LSLLRSYLLQSAGAKTRYNLRVVETLVSARILARILGLSALLSPSYPSKKFTLREVLSAYCGVLEVKGQKEPALSVERVKEGLEKLVDETERLKASVLKEGQKTDHFEEEEQKEQGLTLQEMIEYSGLTKREFEDVYLSWVDGQLQLFSISPGYLMRYNQSRQHTSSCINAPSTSSQKPSAFWNFALPVSRSRLQRKKICPNPHYKPWGC
jgi:galactokinase